MNQSYNEDLDCEKMNIMTLGNGAVGKTSFIIKYTENAYQEVYLSTIGIDFKCKIIKINDKKYKIYLYDTTGQERFRALTLNVIKNAQAIILMYDITNTSSFESIPGWIKSVKESKGEDFPMILLGNKLDKNEVRQINKEDGEHLAKENGIDFFEISNKDGTNINESVMTLINKIIKYNEKHQKEFNANDTSVLTNQSFMKKKKKCC